jgi:hypothetical protein
VAATHADCIKGALMVITKSPGPIARTFYIPNAGELRLRYFPSRNRWLVVLSALSLID